MRISSRTIAKGVALAAILVAVCALAAWWLLRPGAVIDRLELVGPQTQGFVTFLAGPDDEALHDLLESIQKRGAAGPGSKEAEWLRSLGDTLSGAVLDNVRATALVEELEGGGSDVAVVVSLGRMARMIAKMWFGISGSEREVEVYRKVRILHAREKQDLAMAFVGNNLILSRDPRAVRLVIDRLKGVAGPIRTSERVGRALKDVDPRREMPGFGALVNEPPAVASLWRMVTGAPEGSEIALPENFEEVGFRFGFRSDDILVGDGYAYFRDEEAAQGAIPLVNSAVPKLFGRFGLEAGTVIEQEGRRLKIAVEAKGIQKALGHYFKPSA